MKNAFILIDYRVYAVQSDITNVWQAKIDHDLGKLKISDLCSQVLRLRQMFIKIRLLFKK